MRFLIKPCELGISCYWQLKGEYKLDTWKEEQNEYKKQDV